jgi:FkbH-like protein
MGNDAVILGQLEIEDILIKRKALKRRLSAQQGLQPLRIAVLGGSTTSELVDLWELYLLESGFLPIFHQSEFGRFYVDAVHDSAALVEFKPDLVYIHTWVGNLQGSVPLQATDAECAEQVHLELARFQEIWQSIEERIGSVVIQNNFELPLHAILGNLDATIGQTRFVTELNHKFAKAARETPKLLLQDVLSISARIGLNRWFDPERWFSYKIATTPEASRALAESLSAIVRAIYGKTRKVLVLDLDNTLWGGVIGDDGMDKIQIGRETPVAEAYTAFQEYCLTLRNRGVLLAVCSKNDEETAKQGFNHPDSVLKLEHISCFKANWQPKHENILAIAHELNLGPDSFVFVDDNPAERAIVDAQVPGIAVPDIGSDVTAYATILETGRYFEQVSFSNEDTNRAALYQENLRRVSFEAKFADYGEYLDSLEMTAEIDRFKPLYLDRITQLTNKTNQFNLTTRRYTIAEMESVLNDRNAIGLYGKLSDRFGDNGLISIILGYKRGDAVEIDLWLMSCRVLKRDVEIAMLDALAENALAMGASRLIGRYIPTRKNSIVADHYAKLGFAWEGQEADGSTIYSLDITIYKLQNAHISVLELVHG